eukprot:8375918-Pyramimonas_sp.AAC.1
MDAVELIEHSDPGRGRPVLPAAQRGASCPVDHPCRGPLLLQTLLSHLSYHSRIQFSHHFVTDAICPRRALCYRIFAMWRRRVSVSLRQQQQFDEH